MTIQEIQGGLMLSGVRLNATLPLLYDASYARPARRWLTQDFYPWFKAKLADQGLSYDRKHDCDNFARKFCVYAQDAHALTKGAPSEEGLAVGEFCYVSTKLGPHAIVCAFVEANQLVFIEPQTGQVLNLSPEEISSCFALHM